MSNVRFNEIHRGQREERDNPESTASGGQSSGGEVQGWFGSAPQFSGGQEGGKTAGNSQETNPGMANATHCPDCHTDYLPRQRHVFNCVAKENPDCSVCPSPARKKLEAEIREHIKKYGRINLAEGIFGDYNQNMAYFGEAVMTDKGMQYPIFGCSYLYPNTLLGAVHDSCTSLKRTLMATLGLVFKYWWFFSPLPLIFYKLAFRAFVYWFAEIYESDLKQKTYKYLFEFSPVPREMIRAGLVLAERIPLERPVEDDGGPYGPLWNFHTQKEFEGIDGQEFRIRVKRCIWAIGTFVQSDSAYRMRPQDALVNLNKENLWRNPRKEILRLFDIVLERDRVIKHKTALIRKLASLLLLFPPALKLAFDYFNELNVERFKPDEADRYFASRIQGYDFEGKSVEERKKWADEIDKSKGHTILKT